MNQEIKEKWISALRSGEYKQGKRRLRSKDDTYCCLGVLCDLHSKENGNKWKELESQIGEIDCYGYFYSTALLPVQVSNWAKSGHHHEGPLVALNDGGSSFEEIANYIQENM